MSGSRKSEAIQENEELPLLHFSLVAYEKEAFRSPSTTAS